MVVAKYGGKAVAVRARGPAAHGLGGRATREASLATDSPPPELCAATFTDPCYEN